MTIESLYRSGDAHYVDLGDKQIRLSAKEKARADRTIVSDRLVTVVSRPASGGGYNVFSVDVASGFASERAIWVRSKSMTSVAAKEVMRWLDKMGSGGMAAHWSRDRMRR